MNEFSWSDPPAQMVFPIYQAGYPLIFGSAFVTLIFALLGLTALALIALTATFCICGFFRDPERVIPKEDGAVVSPADGKVIWAGKVESNRFISGDSIKISIFMSIFNVHVNRIPYEGRIKTVNYHPGKFFSANLDKASEKNEHNAVFLEMQDGSVMCVVQVAGLIARRIICKVQSADQVLRGQRFGIICFGSRLDVYLPGNTHMDVTAGDKVRAGTSILGHLK